MNDVDQPQLQIRAQRKEWHGPFVDLLICSVSKNKWDVVEPLTTTMHELPPHAPAEPTLTISIDAAQRLLDNLWDCGLRPTQGKGSAGQLAAVERHLHDMRIIALDKLGIIADARKSKPTD